MTEAGATSAEYGLLVIGLTLVSVAGAWATSEAFSGAVEAPSGALETPYIAPDVTPTPHPMGDCWPWGPEAVCNVDPYAAGLTDAEVAALPVCDLGATSPCRIGW